MASKVAQFKSAGDSSSYETKKELHKYIEDIEEPGYEGFDILQWWKASSSKYPIVAKMAKDILVILVSSVASESAFTMGERKAQPGNMNPRGRIIGGCMDLRRVRKISIVWTEFETFTDEEDMKKARCNHRSKVFNADMAIHGIALLIRHLNICPQRPANREVA
ncbi:uncharacterized protein LOC143595655 [Bidens hawaiensis]|uniref:uncharacterized protein LOC143595655 n=1 Tax=Bidens hawaiensis TaxID=980011 RepID=UPI00404A760C